MKSFPILLSFGALLALLFFGVPQTGGSQATDELLVTFDGYEGGYYFFTKEDFKAVQLVSDDEVPLYGYDLVAGDFVGKKFKLLLKKKENNEDATTISKEEVVTLQITQP